MRSAGQVHLYYGDGKGKTTASVGLAVRAFGAGFDVQVVQFLKDGCSSEMAVLRDRLGISVLAEQATYHMSFAMSEDEKSLTRECHERIWKRAMDWVGQAVPDLYAGSETDSQGYMKDARTNPAGRILILDEIIGAIEAGLFPEDKLISFLDHRPPDLEVVLTGRNPSASIIQRSDYRSQIICEGHPYNNGIPAREGIEF